jgi:hypothetical protein
MQQPHDCFYHLIAALLLMQKQTENQDEAAVYREMA